NSTSNIKSEDNITCKNDANGEKEQPDKIVQLGNHLF
ncbi:unnamed protein product, partial [Rotaria sp. Silwood2]